MAKENAGVTAYSVHPGVIATGLTRSMMSATMTKIVYSFLPTKSVPQGAATSVFASVSPKAVAGEYHYDCNVDLKGSHPHFRDAAQAARLWTVSEEMIAAALARASK